MGFNTGDQIEVASKVEGFVGSYYEATVIRELVSHKYLVQYKNLVEKDLSTPLREVVTAAEVRPPPPASNIPATGFSTNDIVDAFDNDGWWVGIVSGKVGTKYAVYFDCSDDEIEYEIDMLRVHRDWINGKWVLPKKKSSR